MNFNKKGRLFTVNCDTEDEQLLMEFVTALLSGIPDENFKLIAESYKMRVETCEHEVKSDDVIFKCGLPKGHKGNRHIPFLTWND